MGESPKVEARLKEVMRVALGLYMKDKHLDNQSEVLKTALRRLLESEGDYLTRAEKQLKQGKKK